MARCPTTTWRGVRVCKHSVPKLNAWAKAVGDDIYIKPIQGCYSNSVAASKGTHDGGGVCDVEMDGYSLSQRNRSVNSCRDDGGLIGHGRWWEDNFHIHLIDPECPDLHETAEDQVEQWRRGETGLVGYDPDQWSTRRKAELLRQYDSRFTLAAPVTGKHRTYRIGKGGTLGAAAAALGVTVAALAGYNHISNPNVVHPGQVVTAPPSGYKPPAPKVSVKPKATVKPKPAPKPVAKPKPKANPAPKASGGFRPIASQRGVYLHLVKPGVGNSTSVYRYEQAVRRYLGVYAAKYGLTVSVASDGYYGTATQAATRAVYRDLASKCRNCGWTPNATTPGPALLRVLGLPVHGG